MNPFSRPHPLTLDFSRPAAGTQHPSLGRDLWQAAWSEYRGRRHRNHSHEAGLLAATSQQNLRADDAMALKIVAALNQATLWDHMNHNDSALRGLSSRLSDVTPDPFWIRHFHSDRAYGFWRPYDPLLLRLNMNRQRMAQGRLTYDSRNVIAGIQSGTTWVQLGPAIITAEYASPWDHHVTEVQTGSPMTPAEYKRRYSGSIPMQRIDP